MSRASGLRFRALTMILATAAGCTSSAAPATLGPIATASIAAPASGGPQLPVSPVEGVLLDIDSSGLTAVDGFTLRLRDGREVAFRVGAIENGDEFPVGHLAEHLATSAPVRVFFRTDGGDTVVYRIEDAE